MRRFCSGCSRFFYRTARRHRSRRGVETTSRNNNRSRGSGGGRRRRSGEGCVNGCTSFVIMWTTDSKSCPATPWMFLFRRRWMSKMCISWHRNGAQVSVRRKKNEKRLAQPTGLHRVLFCSFYCSFGSNATFICNWEEKKTAKERKTNGGKKEELA